MDNMKCIVLLRGHKPLLLDKITPEEFPVQARLKYVKITEYTPDWRKGKPTPDCDADADLGRVKTAADAIVQEPKDFEEKAAEDNNAMPLAGKDTGGTGESSRPAWYTDKSYLGFQDADSQDEPEAEESDGHGYGKFSPEDISSVISRGMIELADD